jgi:hypothetical protein
LFCGFCFKVFEFSLGKQSVYIFIIFILSWWSDVNLCYFQFFSFNITLTKDLIWLSLLEFFQRFLNSLNIVKDIWLKTIRYWSGNSWIICSR